MDTQLERRHFLRLLPLALLGESLRPTASAQQAIPRSLASIHKEISKHKGASWALSKKGRIQGGSNLRFRAPIFSITKVIAALLVSRAVSEGWLNLNDPVSDTFSTWKKDSRKREITLLHLLQQNSGLESGVSALYSARPQNKSAAAIQLQCVNEPNDIFRYGPASWELIASVLDTKLRDKQSSLMSFIQSRVLDELGLYSPRWRKDGSGVPYLSTGAELNCEEMLTFGFTISKLLTGNNHQGFKSKDFIEATTPSLTNPMFGGGLWRSSPGGTHPVDIEKALKKDTSFPWNSSLVSPFTPSMLYMMIGSGGKRIYLWPRAQLALTRHGYSSEWSDVQFLNRRNVQVEISEI